MPPEARMMSPKSPLLLRRRLLRWALRRQRVHEFQRKPHPSFEGLRAFYRIGISTCDACDAPVSARPFRRSCAAGSRRPRCADLGSSADREIGDTDTGVADTLP